MSGRCPTDHPSVRRSRRARRLPAARMFAVLPLACVIGSAAIARTAAVPALVLVHPGVHTFEARWQVTNASGFTATLELRRNAGSWTAERELVADSDGVVAFTLSPLRLGTIYEARLSGFDQGVPFASEVAVDSVPAAGGANALIPHTDGVEGTSIVSPADPALTWKLERAEVETGPWSEVPGFAAESGGTRRWSDPQDRPGTRFVYRLRVEDGVGSDTVGTTAVTTLLPPTRIARRITPEYVDYTWSVPDPRTYQLAFALVDPAGGHTLVEPVYADEQRRARYRARFVGEGAVLTSALRWVESDGRERFTAPDTSVQVPAEVTLISARFGSRRIVVHWQIHPVDSAFSVSISRSDGNTGRVTYVGSFNTGAGPDLVYDDRDVVPGRLYGYLLSWSGGSGAWLLGASHAAPTVGAARSEPDRIELGWRYFVPISPDTTPSLTGWLERRVDGGAWARLADVRSVRTAAYTFLVDSVGFTDVDVTPGPLYEYRLAWVEPFDTLRSDPVAARVPSVHAELSGFEAAPEGTRLRWHVVPDDTCFTIRVVRRETGAVAWDTLGLATGAGDGRRTYLDTTAVHAHAYVYRLVWMQGGVPGASAEEPVAAFGLALSLGAPSPNPARGTFRVAFALPDPRRAKLEVFDVSGRSRLARTYEGPGNFSFTLSRGELEPGLYVLRLSPAGRGALLRKVVVAP